MGESRVQRRLAAILAADVVGFSRMMGTDEEGTLARLRQIRSRTVDPVISDYAGRIVKEMGDGLLVEFASVVDAVQCAVEIQNRMANEHAAASGDGAILFRIGVNLGDVIAEGEDILGDGVNIAARLEKLAEPGGVCISGAAFDHVRNKLHFAFEDLGPQSVKNIDQPIAAYRFMPGKERPDTAAPKGGPRASGRGWLIPVAAVIAIIAIGAGSAVYWWPSMVHQISRSPERRADSASDRPSIAVLPFINMSADSSQEYFVDGMTEDLITDLSKLSSLFVIARNSVFTYKGRAVRPETVARELGVRYVLEGSVRTSADRVRINAQLTDGTSGGHIWADRFDREMGDIFALQDDVTRKIVDALALELTPAEAARLSSAEGETSPEVYDIYLRGIDALRQFTAESIENARGYFLRALSIDPDYARAHAAMAFTYSANPTFFRTDRTKEDIAEALRYGERAIELDETLPQAHFAMAITLLRAGRHAEARQAVLRAIEYDPNYADAYVALATVENFSGNSPEGEKAILRAMELNPRYSAAYIDILARSYFMAGRYDEAISTFKSCVERDPANLSCRAFLAASYGLTGQMDNAEWEGQELLSLEPEFSLANNTIATLFLKSEDRDRFLEGIRLASIPEK